MSHARFVIGDTRAVTATIPDGSVDLIITSPPFLALRSYLPADHPDKALEIGSEASPADFLDVLLDLTVEWRRVLAPHGSLVVELGDTYSESGGAGGDYNDGGLRDGQQAFSGSAAKRRKAGIGDDYRPARSGRFDGWPLAKSLCGIPHLYHLSLAYGRNLLNPAHTIEPWRIRNVVAWCRPNPPVGALGDKFRPATSYLTVACVSDRRYFDLDAVRTAAAENLKPHTDNRGGHKQEGIPGRTGQVMNPVDENGHRIQSNPAGAPPLDWWKIPTAPYAGAHYAAFPKALLTRPILAMSPQRVCRTCGKPSVRITSAAEAYAEHLGESWADRGEGRTKADQRERNSHSGQPANGRIVAAQYETLGWSDCGHDDWRNGLVFDPFGGSGTTGAVATGHGRDCLMIDIDERNAHLAVERVGMFLAVEHHTPKAVA